MQKIIALDIGSYSIKAVEILNKFKSYEVSNYYEKILPHSEQRDAEKITETLRALFEENQIKPDRIVTAMPGQYISSRIMGFNFSDPQKIQAAIYSEIEDIVPFNLDEMILDHQNLGNIGERSYTLVVLTKKEFVGNFLETLKSIDIDPKIIDVDSLSFYNLSPFLGMEMGKVYGIVDIGHEKTSVCLVENHILRMFRSINLGGRYITGFIAKDMQISFEKAEELKHRVSLILTEDYPMQSLSAEDREVAERMTLAMKSIARELGRTLYAFKTWEKAPIEKIFCSGGSSYTQNLDKYLESQLSVPAQRINLSTSALQYNPRLQEKLPVMSQGIAIGLRTIVRAKRHSQINLRRGPFAYVQDYAAILNTASIAAKVIALAVFLLCLGYGVKYFFYNKEIQGIQALYVKELNSIPESAKKVKSKNVPFPKLHKDSIAFIKNRVNQKSQAFQEFVDSNAESGALATLQKISEKVPVDVKFDVMDFDYTTKPDGSGVLRLRIEAESFEMVDKVRDALVSVEEFKDFAQKSSDTKPGTDMKIAVFETSYKPRSMN